MKNSSVREIFEMMSHQELVDLCMSYREIITEVGSEDVDFNDFWDAYHKITSMPKTDMQPAKKHWNRLTKKERKSALDNIENYFLSLPTYSSGKPIKKARTYLADKNFLDEFVVKKNTQHGDLSDRYRSDGKPIKISIEQVAVNNWAEFVQYCKENEYDPKTGESLI